MRATLPSRRTAKSLAVPRCHSPWLVEKWKRMLDFGVTLKSVLKDT